MAITKEKPTDEVNKPTCGIIMPISQIDNCSKEHWAEVLEIIRDVCDYNKFKSNLVSDSDEVGIIQKRIVENIYSSDIVICDVSCKNANVMFELGMRLAFDKPTIIIKDDQTDYSFDTSVIEHLEYPRDLRFSSIIKFKEILGKKIVATLKKSKDPNYSTFLKNFGSYKIAHLDEKEISSTDYIINAIEDLKIDIQLIKSNPNVGINSNHVNFKNNLRDKVNVGILNYLLENDLNFNSDLESHIQNITIHLARNSNLTSYVPFVDLQQLVTDCVDNLMLS